MNREFANESSSSFRFYTRLSSFVFILSIGGGLWDLILAEEEVGLEIGEFGWKLGTLGLRSEGEGVWVLELGVEEENVFLFANLQFLARWNRPPERHEIG